MNRGKFKKPTKPEPLKLKIVKEGSPDTSTWATLLIVAFLLAIVIISIT